MYVILIILLFLSIFLNYKNNLQIENMSNDEALQNVSTLYNTQNMKVSNLEITSNLTIGGDVTKVNKVYATNGIHIPSNGGWGNMRPGNSGDPPGRTFLGSDDNLYIHNKQTIISKYSGGSGNMSVEGDLGVANKINSNVVEAKQFIINGVDIRDFVIGAIGYDQDNNSSARNYGMGKPFVFPTGKYTHKDSGGEGWDVLDAFHLNPGFRLKVDGGFKPGDEWGKEWSNNSTSQMYIRLDRDGARINQVSYIEVSKL
jgi:hypothetical protein